MGRPEREKRICRRPAYDRFAPDGETCSHAPIILSVEEYETLRWIDLEGTSREECAERMDIARTTAQAIYNSARKKIAECIVNGYELHIEGGTFRYCDGSAGCTGCRRYADINDRFPKIGDISEKEEGDMRIAVTYENGKVFQHFGHTELFKIYEVDGSEIKSSDIYGTQGTGHGALAGVLAGKGIDVLICGGLGGGAVRALGEAGVQVVSGAEGDADEAVKAFLAGELVSTGANCDRHGHGEGHSCGDKDHGHGEGGSCGKKGRGKGGSCGDKGSGQKGCH